MANRQNYWLRAASAVFMAATATVPSGAEQPVERGDAAVVEASLKQDAPPRAVPGSRPTAAATQGAEFSSDVMAGAILVQGATSIRSAAFAPVVEPFVGRPLSAGDLKALTSAVADVARGRGYVFATAWIAPQSLQSGLLRVTIDEGRLGGLRLDGADRPAIRRALGGLADGLPVRKAAMERALLLAGDLPGVRIVESAYRRGAEDGTLHVTASADRVSGYASIDNWGSRSVGPYRARARVAFNDALLAGDQLQLRTTVTPLQPRELLTGGAEYLVTLGASGTTLNLGGSYTNVRPGRDLRDEDIDGRSVSVSTGIAHPLVRSLNDSLWTSVDLALRDSKQDRAAARVQDDRIVTASFGLNGYTLLANGWLSGRLSLRQGLDIFDATGANDPRASREDGSGRFSKIEASASWTGPVAPGVSLRLAAEGQIASRPLLSSEEMGIGGPRLGRGYDYSEEMGDRGVAALTELRFDVAERVGPLEDVQVYGFGDVGYVDDLRRAAGGDTLTSAGAGLRFDLGDIFEGELEAGFPIGQDRFDSGDRSPRLSFSLNANF